MKKITVLVGALALTLATSAVRAAPADPHDGQFAQGAALSNMFEIEESKIILETSTDPTLRRFAQEMIDDHGLAQIKLDHAGAMVGVPTSFVFDPGRQKLVNDIGLMEGKTLDDTYVADQVEAHASAAATLDGYLRSGGNPVLRAYAADALPVVLHHQHMLEAITGQPSPK